MFRTLALLIVLATSALPVRAQFALEDSHTTASLRGIHSLGDGVAWASGAEGTILRTEDGGSLWQHCAVPQGAEKLDFRGIQGFDARTAVVMSSGKGGLSRIYKTTDGCRSWKLVFTNPDADGFFDAIRKVTSRQMYVLGDPVGGRFAMFYSPDGGDSWLIADDPGLESEKGDGAFAASNASLLALGATMFFGGGGPAGPSVYHTYAKCPPATSGAAAAPEGTCPLAWARATVPLASGSAAGVFALAGRTSASMSGKVNMMVVAVGGDYEESSERSGTAAVSADGGQHWTAAATLPQGYRSAIAYDPLLRLWLAVGPNGADISKDDGKNWTSLTPKQADAAGSDQGWNAISLPFVVGAKGRIGKLRADALQ